MADDLAEEYQALVNRAISLLGSESAVCGWLGLGGHGAVRARLNRPDSIKREHVFALQSLVSRVSGGDEFKNKYPGGNDLSHSCGGYYEHKAYTNDSEPRRSKQATRHWETMECNSCGMLMVRQVLKMAPGA